MSTKPFVLGRRCPDSEFKQSLARQMRMLSLVADAEYIDQLSNGHPSLYGLFAVNNALHDQERGVRFIHGENQRDFLDRLTGSDHTPTEALDGLLSAGVDDMAEAHRKQLPEAKRESSKRRQERKPHGKRNRVRPLSLPERRAGMTRTCRSHCSSCGTHFSGDESFDLHRVGSFRVPSDHFDARRCLDPSEDSRFTDVAGECRISDPDRPKAGVRIWSLARRLETPTPTPTSAEPQTLTGGVLSPV